MPVEESKLYVANIDAKDLIWFDRANCKGTDTESFFIEKGEAYPKELRQICNRCEVKGECLNFAVKYKTLGFWGGTSELDRRQMTVAKKINSSAF